MASRKIILRGLVKRDIVTSGTMSLRGLVKERQNDLKKNKSTGDSEGKT